MTLGERQYQHLVEQTRDAVKRIVPAGAITLVVSRGDPNLVELDPAVGWHVPRRSDGVYAGHYPADGEAAVRHLESLRELGGRYLVIPATSLWWLEQYPALRMYLQSRCELVFNDSESCNIYLLPSAPLKTKPAGGAVSNDLDEGSADLSHILAGIIPSTLRGQVATLFDVDYYRSQAGVDFVDYAQALLHYVTEGHVRGLDPHPLFWGEFYRQGQPEGLASGAVPLLHYLASESERRTDPNPYFDEAYYLEQCKGTLPVPPLVHYESDKSPPKPNPLFANRFYLNQGGGTGRRSALAHYLTSGAAAGRPVSAVQRDIVASLSRGARSGLVRGQWKDCTVLFVASGEEWSWEVIAETADLLAREHHCDSIIVALAGPHARTYQGPAQVLILEDYEVACEITRPSALRMLVKTLLHRDPLFAVSDVAELLELLHLERIPVIALAADGLANIRATDIRGIELADRVVLPNSLALDRAASLLGSRPVNAAVRPRPKGGHGTGNRLDATDLLELAGRDLPSAERLLRTNVSPPAGQRVLIPCSDWNVSGVNACLEALAKELVALGWDVEIVFTRDREYVVESAGGEEFLPDVPYRFLARTRRSVDGLWAALLADVESHAPCILFMAYDFLGNSIAPALTDRVGVVTWVQSDDGDYYEQAYRLGRYCNAIVCVSTHISEKVTALNPALDPSTHVIHNASVRRAEIATRRKRSRDTLRLVYAGRLVQYQKRILDFVDLAETLDRTGVPYSISLIGDFSPAERTRETFLLRAAPHLADGRMQLTGRLSRSDILEQMRNSDFFVLLSEFEGLPLALVEGMSQGCVPLVADMDSGIPEIVTDGENGLVCKGRDYTEWAARAVACWQDRAGYQRLSRTARKTIREAFTVERSGQQFDALFREILEAIEAGKYERPPSLHWGVERAAFGDVLPPPSMHRPIQVKGVS